MKAFVLERYGKKRALRSADMPHPDLRDDEVLVQVHAAGVNLLDSKIRDGEFKLILPYRLPLILGHDVAGVVVGVGSRTRQFKLGDEVYAPLSSSASAPATSTFLAPSAAPAP
jgi:alcohol dehydrogenase